MVHTHVQMRKQLAGLRQQCRSRAGVVALSSMEDRYTAPHLIKSSQDGNEEPNAAVEAMQTGTLGVGFSAGGLLFSYFVGVATELRQQRVLTDATPVAGASAGSLIAACCKAGLTHEQLVQATLELAADCRRRGTRHNLGPILNTYLQRLLPDDVHERMNAGRVHVAVTRLLPRIQPELVSSYSSKQDVISALMTSCHIPWYLDGSLLTNFRGSPHCDGGLTNFIPSPTGVSHCVRVCCFPSQQMRSAFGRLCVTPDSFEAWPHDMRTMLGWAFNPCDDEMLLDLVAKGQRDAAAWVAAQPGLSELLAVQAAPAPSVVQVPAAGIVRVPGAIGASFPV